MNMMRCFLAVSISLSLIACGNDSSDKPAPLPEISPPPVGGYEPDFSDYQTVAAVDLAPLASLQGQALIDGIEDQLNASLTTRSAAGQFQIIPQWGYVDNLEVVNVDGQYALQTILDAGQTSKPTGSEKNGFSFKISLPNGLVKQATLSYQINFSTPIGFADSAKSPDYIYLPGLTSGTPEVRNGHPTAAGTGFTYKFSTDRYGYLNAKYADALDGDLTNVQLQYGGKGISPLAGQWDLIQQNVTINDFNFNHAQTNGTVSTYFNRELVTPKTGSTTGRIQVDDTHPYNLQALVEVYRYYKHSADDLSTVARQEVRIKNLSFAWNNEEVALPPPVDDQPDLAGYPNQVQLDLELLAGQTGSALFSGIEQQLNSALPDGTPADQRFKITPKWGVGDGSAWDVQNLTVENVQGQYVLQTTIPAGAVGQPSSSNAIENGFSFLIELPNGKVKEATMAYLYRLSTPLGNGDPSKSPDYIFLPGLTSGDPLVANTASAPGAGFTYKLNTDRYGKLSTRFTDATDNAFYNSVLQQSGTDIRIDANLWHLVQQKLKTNDFSGSTSTADGTLEMIYKDAAMTPKAGAVTGRTQVDSHHDYKLSALMEVYRHWKHSADEDSALKEQIIQLKSITFAWKNEEISTPTAPPAANYCSTKGFSHSRALDLAPLSGLTGQALLDEIGAQLGDLAPSSLSFGNGRDNLQVVDNGGELALQVTYAATAVGQSDTGNGVDFAIPFPSQGSALRGACFAYDIHIAIATSTNKDVILLPSVLVNTNGSLWSDHRYATNKYKRFSAKFGNPPHPDLSWLDYDGNNRVNNGTWYKMNQLMSFDNTGSGHLDFQMNDVTYFKQNSGKFSGVPYQDVVHQLVDSADVDSVSLTANFDTYRSDAGGDNLQTIQYKNIAIGWNE